MKRCAWCEAPAPDEEVVVAPEETVMDRKTKKPRVTKYAITAPACDEHKAMVQRENRRAELDALIDRYQRSMVDPESKQGKRQAREMREARAERERLLSSAA